MTHFRLRPGAPALGLFLALASLWGCADASAAGEGSVAEAATDPAPAIIAAIDETDPALAAELREIHAATARYRDVEAALEDGYIRDPMDMCITPAMEGMPRQLGGMGIHYSRPDLLGITGAEPRVDGVGTNTDFRQPGVLVYEPREDGSLALVAVENLVFRAAWLEAGNEGPPELLGNQYYELADNPSTRADEAHGFMPHYELHMWLYRENPHGLFAQFNPNVTCNHHRGAEPPPGHQPADT